MNLILPKEAKKPSAFIGGRGAGRFLWPHPRQDDGSLSVKTGRFHYWRTDEGPLSLESFGFGPYKGLGPFSSAGNKPNREKAGMLQLGKSRTCRAGTRFGPAGFVHLATV